MDTPSAAQVPTDNVKSQLPSSQKTMMTPYQKNFSGGETMVNEKFRENPIPLWSPPRDAPTPATISPHPMAVASASLPLPSNHVNPIRVETEEDSNDREGFIAKTLVREGKCILGFPRRKFFTTLCVASGCITISLVLFLAIYLTRHKPSPCDDDEVYLPATYVQTPRRGYSYIGCYLSKTADNGSPPAVLNGSTYFDYGPAYDFSKESTRFNNTDCATLCQDYLYFSTGQEKNNTQTCRCGNNLFAGGIGITCNRMCNLNCAYVPNCAGCTPASVDYCGGYGFASVFEGS